jgi:hypothetical protein
MAPPYRPLTNILRPFPLDSAVGTSATPTCSARLACRKRDPLRLHLIVSRGSGRTRAASRGRAPGAPQRGFFFGRPSWGTHPDSGPDHKHAQKHSERYQCYGFLEKISDPTRIVLFHDHVPRSFARIINSPLTICIDNHLLTLTRPSDRLEPAPAIWHSWLSGPGPMAAARTARLPHLRRNDVNSGSWGSRGTSMHS